MAARRGRAGNGRVRRALTAGDRPYVMILLALIMLVGAMAVGPLQVFTEAADRVDELEAERDRLREEVEDLEDRQRRLEDPEEIERIARSKLGLIRPGEIPIVVVPPERESTSDESDGEDAREDAPWYRRLGRWLNDRLGDGG